MRILVLTAELRQLYGFQSPLGYGGFVVIYGG